MPFPYAPDGGDLDFGGPHLGRMFWFPVIRGIYNSMFPGVSVNYLTGHTSDSGYEWAWMRYELRSDPGGGLIDAYTWASASYQLAAGGVPETSDSCGISDYFQRYDEATNSIPPHPINDGTASYAAAVDALLALISSWTGDTPTSRVDGYQNPIGNDNGAWYNTVLEWKLAGKVSSMRMGVYLDNNVPLTPPFPTCGLQDRENWTPPGEAGAADSTAGLIVGKRGIVQPIKTAITI